jgi:hypothetical protein
MAGTPSIEIVRSASPGLVDTAAGATDAGGPAQRVAADGYMWTGTLWTPLRAGSTVDSEAATTLLRVGVYAERESTALFSPLRLSDGAGSTAAFGLAAVPHMFRVANDFPQIYTGRDSQSVNNALSQAPHLYNGVTLDLKRNNAEFSVLASASNAAGTRTSATLTNHNARGVLLGIDVTALGAAESLTLLIDAIPSGGVTLPLTAFAAVTADALYTLYPGALETAAVANHEVQGLALPRSWRARVTTAPGINASTFSVDASYIV